MTHSSCAGFFTLFLLGGAAGGVPELFLSCEPAPATFHLLRHNIKTSGAAEKVPIVLSKLLFAHSLKLSRPLVIASCCWLPAQSFCRLLGVAYLDLHLTFTACLADCCTHAHAMMTL